MLPGGGQAVSPATASRRILDWVTQNNKVTCPNSRACRPNEPCSQRRSKRRLSVAMFDNPEPPQKKIFQYLSPKKFYNSASENRLIPAVLVARDPTTPESKQSRPSQGGSPASNHWLSGLSVRRRGLSPCKPLSDSESAQSTPIKDSSENIHQISNGLDSLDENTSPASTSIKMFFQSSPSRRRQIKDPLRYYNHKLKLPNPKPPTIKRAAARTTLPSHSTKLTPNSVTPESDNHAKIRQSCDCETTPLRSGTPKVRFSSDIKESVQQSIGEKSSTGTVHNNSAKWQAPASTCGKICKMSSNTLAVADEDVNELLDRSNTTLTDTPKLIQKKLLPLFQRSSPSKSKTEKAEQMIIDAGQKDMSKAHQCAICRMVYTPSDPNDEACHKQFHSQLQSALKFPGWKKENVAEDGGDYRVLYIRDDDPPYAIKKVDALKTILDQELGFVQETSILSSGRTMYLYIADKTVRGVCVAQKIQQASKLLGDRASEEVHRALIGINRIWVHAKYRRMGVASRLLEAIRSTFALGLCVPRSEIAFSDPTTHGKRFAEKYTGTSQFLVYKP